MVSWCTSQLLRSAQFVVVATVLSPTALLADDVLFRYEADVLPATDGQPGWLGDGCNSNCVEWVQDGKLVRYWQVYGELAGYGYDIARAPDEPPATLWVEWRFRSDKRDDPFHDGQVSIQFRRANEAVYFSGDSAVSQSGSDGVSGLAVEEFHTYRFESEDGMHYQFSVDGRVFRESIGTRDLIRHAIVFQGQGGSLPLPTTNWWDYVRYGTIEHGERVISADPPSGFLDPTLHAGLDRFTVTYDSPNYVYVDDMTVETSGGVVPVVVQTLRLDNGSPDTVEIVLDRPLPAGEHTRFILDDGVIRNVIDYSYILGDADGNGTLDLADASGLLNCFGRDASAPTCAAFDMDAGGFVDTPDVALFAAVLTGPRRP